MSKQNITKEDLEKLSHISDGEVKNDIEDTLAEIGQEERKAEAQEILFNNETDPMRRKMAAFRRDAALDAVKRRKEFVMFLERLLKAREKTGER